jgi:hypothetical protein
MSTVTGGQGNIVTSGLVLNLDAANPRSYPPPYNGTVWTDLSRSGNNGTLTNFGSQTIFNSANGGNIVLDGTNDYIKPPASTNLQLTNFTLSSWVRINVQNIQQFIIDTSTSLSNGSGYSYRINSDNKIRFWAYDANDNLNSNTIILPNIWYNILVTYNNTTKLQSIYINGVFDISNTHTNTFVVSNLTNLQIGGSSILGGYLNGRIAQTLIYNRALSSSEVLQNFNATRARFGI